MPAAQFNQSGVFGLIAESGPVAKLILVLLFGASVFSWGVIVAKWKALKTAARENRSFLDVFWNGKNINDVLAKTDKYPGSPIALVFKSGMKELKKLSSSNEMYTAGSEGVENIYRALIRAANSEIASFEKNLGWLATTASAAPFVGLFGTVWGIMTSFQSIGATGSANLAVVAPGISEALITTAFGIAAAIPAVIAYNHFSGQIKRIAIEMESFSQDFLNIIHRSILTASNTKGT